MSDRKKTKKELLEELDGLRGKLESLDNKVAALEREREGIQADFDTSRTILDSVPDLLFQIDHDGVFLSFNGSTKDLYAPPDYFLGRKINEVMPPEVAHVSMESMKQVLKTGINQIYEYDLTIKSCKMYYEARMVKNKENEVLVIVRNITDRKRAKIELMESRARYRAMIDSFDGLIYVCSQDYRVEYMNPEFISRTGYDATGEYCYQALHNLTEICPWCENERIFSGERLRWEVLSPKDNRWYYIVNTPIEYPDGRKSKLGMILDITERKQMEESLRNSSEKIKMFAYSVFHDLKNPSVAIHGLTFLLNKKYGPMLTEKGRQYCDRILRSAEQIESLVEKLNIFIATKESPLNIESVNMKELLDQLEEEYAPQYKILNIKMLYDYFFPVVRADRTAVLRIFRNLIDNALKYGGRELRVIEIGFFEKENMNIFFVRNDGVRIDPKDADRIFGWFRRLDNTPMVKGSGLGLAIVKEIAEQHKGDAWLETDETKGNTFYFSLSKKI